MIAAVIQKVTAAMRQRPVYAALTQPIAAKVFAQIERG